MEADFLKQESIKTELKHTHSLCSPTWGKSTHQACLTPLLANIDQNRIADLTSVSETWKHNLLALGLCREVQRLQLRAQLLWDVSSRGSRIGAGLCFGDIVAVGVLEAAVVWLRQRGPSLQLHAQPQSCRDRSSVQSCTISPCQGDQRRGPVGAHRMVAPAAR